MITLKSRKPLLQITTNVFRLIVEVVEAPVVIRCDPPLKRGYESFDDEGPPTKPLEYVESSGLPKLTSWTELRDILSSTFQLLDFHTLMICRLTCKSWRDIIQQLITLDTRRFWQQNLAYNFGKIRALCKVPVGVK